MSVRNSIRDAIRSAIGLVGEVFNPQTLFLSGKQGAWYDPSDLSTLFQDAAGTIPVTGMEQPVGLMLDKRLGLVRGPELAPDPSFDTGTGWLLAQPSSGSTVISGGALRITTTDGSYAAATRIGAANIMAGKYYEYVVEILSVTTGSVVLALGGAWSATLGSVGVFRGVILATSTAVIEVKRSNAGLPSTVVVGSVSVKELPGNHATQATAAQRPILTARKNLLLNTPLAGGTAGIVGAGAVAPTGWSFGAPAPSGEVSYPVTSFDTIGVRFQAVAQRPGLTRTLTALANTVYSNHARITALVGSLEIQNAVWAVGFPVDAVRTFWRNGVTVAGNTIVAAGDHVAVILAMGATAGTFQARFGAGAQTNATCDVTMTMPQVEVSAAPTRYQWVNTPTDYDYIGFPIGLRCDGVDDGMVTGNINFTGTDKMFVCAGVRKLSDAATGAVAELGTESSMVSGSFGLFAPSSSGANSYRYQARGTNVQGSGIGVFAAAPNSAVLSATSDIAAPRCELFKDGISVGPSLGSLGSGNFGTYPLYLFRRGGATLPFNGIFYGAIIAGAAYSASQITSAERYLARKSGVTV